MPIRTKRWNDPKEPGDGTRILITRFRPRALPKSEETWDIWMKELAPSAELLAAFQGKDRPAIGWSTYRIGYVKEVRAQQATINELAQRVNSGESLTLLCASTCTRENRCHRSILKELIESAAARGSTPSA